MTKIEKMLKDNGISKTEFSKLLGISRPTLDFYIKQYEENGKIKNKRMNDIFEEIMNKYYIVDTDIDSIKKKYQSYKIKTVIVNNRLCDETFKNKIRAHIIAIEKELIKLKELIKEN